MTNVAESRFVYVSYIKTTREKLWEALTSREFMAQYWLGAKPEIEPRIGGKWKIVLADGRVADTGEITEVEPGKRLTIRWQNEFMPELKAEGTSTCTMEIEPQDGGAMKLTVTHTMQRADSKLIVAVGGGWPKILSNLKSLLETGSAILPDKH
jgi:uncharacterized protein YndB with AHSA1/START domain